VIFGTTSFTPGLPALRGRLGTPAARRVGLSMGIVTAAAVLLVTLLPQLGPPHERGIVPWWSLILLFFAAESYALAIRDRSESSALSVHDACVVFGLFVAPPAGLIVAQIAGSLLAAAAFKTHKAGRLSRRIGGLALSTSTVILVFSVLDGIGNPYGPAGWFAATFALVCGTLVGYALSLLAVAVGAERRTGGTSRAALVLALGGSVASSAIALAGLELVRRHDPAALLLVVPFASCALALRAYASERLRLVHLQELYASMRVAEGASGLEAGATELLTSARRLLQADAVWLALLPHGDSRRYAVSELSQSGHATLAPADLSQPESAFVRAVLAERGVVMLGDRRGPRDARPLMKERGLRRALATVLHGDRGPVGIMLVGNVDDEAWFGAEDVRLLETYAGHAGVLLENDRLEASVSELTAVKEQFRHQAFHDSLTELPNRMLFTEHVARSLALGLKTAVLFLDLDDFKVVNDRFGHPVGDSLLVAFSDRLKACVRPADVPARLGGDEFAVLADGSNAEEVERVATRLVEALSEPFRIDGKEVSIHASVGIAFATPTSTADELVRNADVAMYDAKQAGKRQVASYEPEMRDRVRGRNETAAALERSVGLGEINVHYQPIVDLVSNRMVAVEALARWQRTGRELLSPISFIPLADEIGVMVDIGRAVVREACVQARSWQSLFHEHDGLTINVNLAPSELHSPSLAREIAAVLEETGLEPSRLVLEITESGVMHQPVGALAAMRSLRELGVRLALDEFGTGHSSLAHLRELPLNTLKIAKPFIAGLPDGHADVAFVEAIVRLATSLEMDVIAEGIETAAQAKAALSLGCGFGQGFFFGSPLGQIGVTPYLTAGALPTRPDVARGGGIIAA
jgi:diguanylate cyclase (GGDEF)-like protein